jgi:hypothetical protein
MQVRSVLVLGAMGLQLVMGCSTSTQLSEPRAREIAQAVCDFGARCCSAGERAYYLGPFVGEGDCADRMVDSAALDTEPSFGFGPSARVYLPNLAALDRALRDGRVHLNRAAFDACIDWMEQQECSVPSPMIDEDVCDPPAVEESPCDVDLIVEGRVREGGACSGATSSFECRDDMVCLTDSSSLGEEGACAAPQIEGETCFSDSECAADLYCSYLDGTCKVPAGLGDACQYSDDTLENPEEDLLLIRCEEGLTCSILTSTCVALCERGSSCFSDVACGEDTGLVCVEAGEGAGVCDQPRTAGTRCAEQDDCQATLRCVYDVDTDQSFCRAKLPNGDPCDGDAECASDVCAYNAVALEYQCIAPRAIAATCDSNKECTSGFCTGVCTATVANGAACSSGQTAQCTTGYCAYDEAQADYYCVAYRADGAACIGDHQCASDACVAGVCASPPLVDGSGCDSSFDCASRFCNTAEDTWTCRTPPLANDTACNSSAFCESGVCFEGTCQTGAAAGASCAAFDDLPCDPNVAFCDTDLDEPVCTTYRAPGESCSRGSECRGACNIRWGRQMCDASPNPGAAICDGV